jgi:hypothetical protein
VNSFPTKEERRVFSGIVRSIAFDKQRCATEEQLIEAMTSHGLPVEETMDHVRKEMREITFRTCS